MFLSQISLRPSLKWTVWICPGRDLAHPESLKIKFAFIMVNHCKKQTKQTHWIQSSVEGHTKSSVNRHFKVHTQEMFVQKWAWRSSRQSCEFFIIWSVVSSQNEFSQSKCYLKNEWSQSARRDGLFGLTLFFLCKILTSILEKHKKWVRRRKNGYTTPMMLIILKIHIGHNSEYSFL